MSVPFAENLPLGPGVAVLTAHPTGLVALDKPSGVLSHPNAPGSAKNILLAADYDLDRERYAFAGPDGRTRHAYLLNRLDSPTSGVVLVALDAGLAESVKAMFAEREVAKTYHAVIKGGRLIPEKGLWRDSLTKAKTDSGRHVRASAGGPSGAEALTHYAWIRANRENPPLSLVRLEPKTGRTHQLRIQTAMRGQPVLGDKTYGDFALNRRLAERRPEFDRLFLHCSKTEFRYEWNGREHAFLAESPTPSVFESVIGGSDGRQVAGLHIRLKPKR